MSAMLSNPLTPPNELASTHSAGLDSHGTPSAASLNYYGAQQFTTAISIANMGLDDKLDLEDRAEYQDMSDGDQDMSDGGAPLTMTLSHAEQLNVEMDMLEAEIMGPENLHELLIQNHFPTTLEATFPYDESPSDQNHHSPEVFDQPQHTLNESYMQGMGSDTNLPNTMSAVSLQLQHHLQAELLQDGQEHVEALEEAEEINSVINSIPSILLPYYPATGFQPHNTGGQAVQQSVSVSLLENVAYSNAQVLWGLQNASPMLSTQGLGPSSQGVVVSPLSQPTAFHNVHTAGHPPTVPNDFPSDTESVADGDEVQDSRNFSLIEFLYNWNHQFSRSEDSRRRPRVPAIPALVRQRSEKLTPVERSDLQGEKCDIQRINWEELGVKRLEARQMRRHTYRNYTSIPQRPVLHPRQKGSRLVDDQNFFRFRKMDFDHTIHLSHFQLRNLLACASRDHIFYAGKAKVLHCKPQSDRLSNRASVAMDLTNPVVQPFHSLQGGIHVTTLTVAHDILVAGGYDGEYSLMNLKASKQTKHTEGLITDHQNSITNHVQVHLSRGSSLPRATFASNDSGVRILDISTNKFIAEHNYDHAINCTAISPDQRLRVLVGDTTDVMICNAATGEVLQSLEGHRDYGFACDWADDGWTVASGNQDMQVKIWDARKWTNSSGVAQPIATIAADMAGVRKLKFSPLGSGKRVLLAAEPADIISVIDGESFTQKQTLSFFGEIGGVDFTNDGQDLVVANCDSIRGGIMEFERCDMAGGGIYGLEEYNESRYRSRVRRGRDGYDWMDAEDDELIAHPRARGTGEQRRRKPASLASNMGYF